jgi:hypothetical protein
MFIEFRLSMPNIGSWNGQWTGSKNYYAIVRTISKSDKELIEKLRDSYFHYNFGDGWSAGITTRMVDAKEKNKIKKASNGFCGYDWMVSSILKHGEIKIESEES